MYLKFGKLIVDYGLAIVLLAFVSPILLLIYLIVFFSTNENPLFIQKRAGKDNAPFDIIKFKTMNSSVDDEGILFPDALRLTKVGAFLRRNSLDELPQLFNILNGTMSLVGPRPLPLSYVAHFTEEEYNRLQVKPGITGIAQISGRNLITYKERFEMDFWYVDHVSLWVDIKILFRTLGYVLSKHGINEINEVTAQPYNGHN